LYCPVLHCSTLPPGINPFSVNNNNNKYFIKHICLRTDLTKDTTVTTTTSISANATAAAVIIIITTTTTNNNNNNEPNQRATVNEDVMDCTVFCVVSLYISIQT
jgi:hypothetical protein